MKRTSEEIDAEIAKLGSLYGKLVPQSAFGDDNEAALSWAIDALDYGFSKKDVEKLFADQEMTENEYDAALFAIAWREGEEDEPYSEGLPMKGDV